MALAYASEELRGDPEVLAAAATGFNQGAHVGCGIHIWDPWLRV